MRWIGVALACVFETVCVAAWAAPPADQPEAPAEEAASASTPKAADPALVQRAREAFRLGSSLAEQGQFRDALAAFERSQHLLPHPTTTYDIGYCERALGHYTRARKSLLEAREQDRRAGGGKLGPDLERQLDAYLVEANRKIVHLQVEMSGPAALAVDGRPLEVETATAEKTLLVAGTRDPGPGESPPATSFELLVDPGNHSFVALAYGETRVSSHSFEPGATTILKLDVPAPEATPGKAPPPPDRTWSYLAFGIGGAGIVTGSVIGVAALSKKSQLDDVCPTPSECPANRQADIDTMGRYATVSTIAFGVGVAGIAVGTLLLIFEPDQPVQMDTSARVEPWIGLGAAGLHGQF